MLSAEQIQKNWDEFLLIIDKHISSPRKEKLIQFYKKYENRFIMMPASHKPQYHNCFPGGYIDHVIRVVNSCIKLYPVWESMGTDMTTFTFEELIFSALNHDLGKFGSEQEAAYLDQVDEWRKDKLGENYMFNNSLEYMSVPDRSLYLLINNGIEFSKNEMLAIKLHDGLYDESNKSYLTGYLPEQKPRSSIIYILHHADLMAARIEFEKEWFPKFKSSNSNQSNIGENISSKSKKSKSQIKNEILGETLNKVSTDILTKFFK